MWNQNMWSHNLRPSGRSMSSVRLWCGRWHGVPSFILGRPKAKFSAAGNGWGQKSRLGERPHLSSGIRNKGNNLIFAGGNLWGRLVPSTLHTWSHVTFPTALLGGRRVTPTSQGRRPSPWRSHCWFEVIGHCALARKVGSYFILRSFAKNQHIL